MATSDDIHADLIAVCGLLNRQRRETLWTNGLLIAIALVQLVGVLVGIVEWFLGQT